MQKNTSSKLKRNSILTWDKLAHMKNNSKGKVAK